MTLFEVVEEGVMHDVEFMTAAEKRKMLKQWELFLQSGLKKEKFTKALYTHLIMHCSFIAHYSIHGFFATYFESGDDIVHFLSQFDGRDGIPKSIEYSMIGWYTSGDHHDINSEMVRIASKYVPALIKQAQNRQKHPLHTLYPVCPAISYLASRLFGQPDKRALLLLAGQLRHQLL